MPTGKSARDLILRVLLDDKATGQYEETIADLTKALESEGKKQTQLLSKIVSRASKALDPKEAGAATQKINQMTEALKFLQETLEQPSLSRKVIGIEVDPVKAVQTINKMRDLLDQAIDQFKAQVKARGQEISQELDFGKRMEAQLKAGSLQKFMREQAGHISNALKEVDKELGAMLNRFPIIGEEISAMVKRLDAKNLRGLSKALFGSDQAKDLERTLGLALDSTYRKYFEGLRRGNAAMAAEAKLELGNALQTLAKSPVFKGIITESYVLKAEMAMLKQEFSTVAATGLQNGMTPEALAGRLNQIRDQISKNIRIGVGKGFEGYGDNAAAEIKKIGKELDAIHDKGLVPKKELESTVPRLEKYGKAVQFIQTALSEVNDEIIENDIRLDTQLKKYPQLDGKLQAVITSLMELGQVFGATDDEALQFTQDMLSQFPKIQAVVKNLTKLGLGSATGRGRGPQGEREGWDAVTSSRLPGEKERAITVQKFATAEAKAVFARFRDEFIPLMREAGKILAEAGYDAFARETSPESIQQKYEQDKAEGILTPYEDVSDEFDKGNRYLAEINDGIRELNERGQVTDEEAEKARTAVEGGTGRGVKSKDFSTLDEARKAKEVLDQLAHTVSNTDVEMLGYIETLREFHKQQYGAALQEKSPSQQMREDYGYLAEGNRRKMDEELAKTGAALQKLNEVVEKTSNNVIESARAFDETSSEVGDFQLRLDQLNEVFGGALKVEGQQIRTVEDLEAAYRKYAEGLTDKDLEIAVREWAVGSEELQAELTDIVKAFRTFKDSVVRYSSKRTLKTEGIGRQVPGELYQPTPGVDIPEGLDLEKFGLSRESISDKKAFQIAADILRKHGAKGLETAVEKRNFPEEVAKAVLSAYDQDLAKKGLLVTADDISRLGELLEKTVTKAGDISKSPQGKKAQREINEILQRISKASAEGVDYRKGYMPDELTDLITRVIKERQFETEGDTKLSLEKPFQNLRNALEPLISGRTTAEQKERKLPQIQEAVRQILPESFIRRLREAIASKTLTGGRLSGLNAAEFVPLFQDLIRNVFSPDKLRAALQGGGGAEESERQKLTRSIESLLQGIERELPAARKETSADRKIAEAFEAIKMPLSEYSILTQEIDNLTKQLALVKSRDKVDPAVVKHLTAQIKKAESQIRKIEKTAKVAPFLQATQEITAANAEVREAQNVIRQGIQQKTEQARRLRDKEYARYQKEIASIAAEEKERGIRLEGARKAAAIEYSTRVERINSAKDSAIRQIQSDETLVQTIEAGTAKKVAAEKRLAQLEANLEQKVLSRLTEEEKAEEAERRAARIRLENLKQKRNTRLGRLQEIQIAEDPTAAGGRWTGDVSSTDAIIESVIQAGFRKIGDKKIQQFLAPNKEILAEIVRTTFAGLPETIINEIVKVLSSASSEAAGSISAEGKQFATERAIAKKMAKAYRDAGRGAEGRKAAEDLAKQLYGDEEEKLSTANEFIARMDKRFHDRIIEGVRNARKFIEKGQVGESSFNALAKALDAALDKSGKIKAEAVSPIGAGAGLKEIPAIEDFLIQKLAPVETLGGLKAGDPSRWSESDLNALFEQFKDSAAFKRLGEDRQKQILAQKEQLKNLFRQKLLEYGQRVEREVADQIAKANLLTEKQWIAKYGKLEKLPKGEVRPPIPGTVEDYTARTGRVAPLAEGFKETRDELHRDIDLIERKQEEKRKADEEAAKKLEETSKGMVADLDTATKLDEKQIKEIVTAVRKLQETRKQDPTRDIQSKLATNINKLLASLEASQDQVEAQFKDILSEQEIERIKRGEAPIRKKKKPLRTSGGALARQRDIDRQISPEDAREKELLLREDQESRRRARSAERDAQLLKKHYDTVASKEQALAKLRTDTWNKIFTLRAKTQGLMQTALAKIEATLKREEELQKQLEQAIRTPEGRQIYEQAVQEADLDAENLKIATQLEQEGAREERLDKFLQPLIDKWRDRVEKRDANIRAEIRRTFNDLIKSGKVAPEKREPIFSKGPKKGLGGPDDEDQIANIRRIQKAKNKAIEDAIAEEEKVEADARGRRAKIQKDKVSQRRGQGKEESDAIDQSADQTTDALKEALDQETETILALNQGAAAAWSSGSMAEAFAKVDKQQLQQLTSGALERRKKVADELEAANKRIAERAQKFRTPVVPPRGPQGGGGRPPDGPDDDEFIRKWVQDYKRRQAVRELAPALSERPEPKSRAIEEGDKALTAERRRRRKEADLARELEEFKVQQAKLRAKQIEDIETAQIDKILAINKDRLAEKAELERKEAEALAAEKQKAAEEASRRARDPLFYGAADPKDSGAAEKMYLQELNRIARLIGQADIEDKEHPLVKELEDLKKVLSDRMKARRDPSIGFDWKEVIAGIKDRRSKDEELFDEIVKIEEQIKAGRAEDAALLKRMIEQDLGKDLGVGDLTAGLTEEAVAGMSPAMQEMFAELMKALKEVAGQYERLGKSGSLSWEDLVNNQERASTSARAYYALLMKVNARKESEEETNFQNANNRARKIEKINEMLARSEFKNVDAMIAHYKRLEETIVTTFKSREDQPEKAKFLSELGKRQAEESEKLRDSLKKALAEFSKETAFKTEAQARKHFDNIKRLARESLKLQGKPDEYINKVLERIERRAQQAFKRVQESQKQIAIGRDIVQQVDRLDQGLMSLSYRFTHVAFQLKVIGAAGIAAFVAPLRAAEEFEREISKIAAIMTTVPGKLDDAFGTDFATTFIDAKDYISDAIKELSSTTVFSAKEIATGLKALSQTALTFKQSMTVLPEIMQFAAAADMNLDDAVRTTIGTMRAFGLQLSEVTRVTETLASAAFMTNAEVKDFSQAFKYVGPVAAKAGLSIEETAAAVGKLSEAGIRGSMGGTTLRKAISELLSPSGKAAEHLDRMGIKILDISGDMLPLADIIGQFNERMKGLGQAGESTGVIMETFGLRAGPGMVALIGAGADELERLTAQIQASAVVSEIAAAEAESLGGSWRMLLNSINSLKISIGQAGAKLAGFRKVIRIFQGVFDAVRKLLDASNELKEAFAYGLGAIGFAGAMTIVVGVLGRMFTGLVSTLSVLLQWRAGKFDGMFKLIGVAWGKLGPVADNIRGKVNVNKLSMDDLMVSVNAASNLIDEFTGSVGRETDQINRNTDAINRNARARRGGGGGRGDQLDLPDIDGGDGGDQKKKRPRPSKPPALQKASLIGRLFGKLSQGVSKLFGKLIGWSSKLLGALSLVAGALGTISFVVGFILTVGGLLVTAYRNWGTVMGWIAEKTVGVSNTLEKMVKDLEKFNEVVVGTADQFYRLGPAAQKAYLKQLIGLKKLLVAQRQLEAEKVNDVALSEEQREAAAVAIEEIDARMAKIDDLLGVVRKVGIDQFSLLKEAVRQTEFQRMTRQFEALLKEVEGGGLAKYTDQVKKLRSEIEEVRKAEMEAASAEAIYAKRSVLYREEQLKGAAEQIKAWDKLREARLYTEIARTREEGPSDAELAWYAAKKEKDIQEEILGLEEQRSRLIDARLDVGTGAPRVNELAKIEAEKLNKYKLTLEGKLQSEIQRMRESGAASEQFIYEKTLKLRKEISKNAEQGLLGAFSLTAGGPVQPEIKPIDGKVLFSPLLNEFGTFEVLAEKIRDTIAANYKAGAEAGAKESEEIARLRKQQFQQPLDDLKGYKTAFIEEYKDIADLQIGIDMDLFKQRDKLHLETLKAMQRGYDEELNVNVEYFATAWDKLTEYAEAAQSNVDRLKGLGANEDEVNKAGEEANRLQEARKKLIEDTLESQKQSAEQLRASLKDARIALSLAYKDLAKLKSEIAEEDVRAGLLNDDQILPVKKFKRQIDEMKSLWDKYAKAVMEGNKEIADDLLKQLKAIGDEGSKNIKLRFNENVKLRKEAAAALRDPNLAPEEQGKWRKQFEEASIWLDTIMRRQDEVGANARSWWRELEKEEQKQAQTRPMDLVREEARAEIDALVAAEETRKQANEAIVASKEQEILKVRDNIALYEDSLSKLEAWRTTLEGTWENFATQQGHLVTTVIDAFAPLEDKIKALKGELSSVPVKIEIDDQLKQMFESPERIAGFKKVFDQFDASINKTLLSSEDLYLVKVKRALDRAANAELRAAEEELRKKNEEAIAKGEKPVPLRRAISDELKQIGWINSIDQLRQVLDEIRAQRVLSGDVDLAQTGIDSYESLGLKIENGLLVMTDEFKKVAEVIYKREVAKAEVAQVSKEEAAGTAANSLLSLQNKLVELNKTISETAGASRKFNENYDQWQERLEKNTKALEEKALVEAEIKKIYTTYQLTAKAQHELTEMFRKDAVKGWETAKEAFEKSATAIGDLASALNAAGITKQPGPDDTGLPGIRRWGGLISVPPSASRVVRKFARGGHLPGYGGGDRRLTLLEDGEYVFNKESVKGWGLGTLEAMRAMFTPGVKLKTANPMNVPQMAQGGSVSSKRTEDLGTLTLTLGKQSFTVLTEREMVNKLKKAIERETKVAR